MHPLDRPVWSALTGCQAAFASGGPCAVRIDPTMGPFAAAADRDDIDALAPLVPADAPLWLVETDAWPSPAPDIVANHATCVQMVAEQIDPPADTSAILMLGDADAAEMRALASLTRPGPFLERTHLYGGFVGIREGGRLAAMAGTRLRPDGHVEVSGVCTHPDHRGHGHAARLMTLVAARILAAGDRPFLHAYADNHGAIALYERLGFRIRRRVVLTELSRVMGS